MDVIRFKKTTANGVVHGRAVSLQVLVAAMQLPAFDVVSVHHLQHLSSLHQSQRLVLSGDWSKWA